MAFDPKRRLAEVVRQKAQIEQQLAQLTAANCRAEGALGILQEQIAADAALPKMEEA